MVVKREKTKRGTWIFLAAVIIISVALSAYSQHQRNQVKQEVDAKYSDQR